MAYIAHTGRTRFFEFCVPRRSHDGRLPHNPHPTTHNPPQPPTAYLPPPSRYTHTMRCVSLLGLLCVLSASAQSIPLSEFRARRAALQKNLEGTVVLFGKAVGGDEVFGF